MTLADTLLRQLDDPTLSRDERARLRCRIAAELEHRGQYEAARDALGELWQGVGQRPKLEGLNELTVAEVLLRAGTLFSWFGSARQLEGAQDAAKDLISESIARFRALGRTAKADAAQSDLGLCYRRSGAYDEARVIYHETLRSLVNDGEKELRAKILLRLAVVESCTGRYSDALRILTDSAQLFEESDNDALKGKFHNDLAGVLTCLSTAEHRLDYTDRAIIEYTAASYHFEQAGHTSYKARAENNIGFLLHTVGRYEAAHEHLDRARRLFVALKEKGNVAQVDETRARVLLAQGTMREAERVIREAVQTLETGGEQGLLAEALTTQGRVLAKLGSFAESLNTLKRAADLAEQAGAVEDAGRALLTLLEEHAARLGEYEMLETYQRANGLLKGTQDAESIMRLRDGGSRIASARLAAIRPRQYRSLADFWANFNLTERVQAYEARYVRRALIDAQGSITRAARLLGYAHHGTLQAMLGSRHKDLAHLRTPPEKRLRSVMRDGRRAKHATAVARPIRILHVEDYKVIADALKETLEDTGYRVETCADAAHAVKALAGDTPYDLLIFDNDLGAGQSGIELMRYARALPRRRRTPIIMFSASDAEPEAWRAGADAFLRKPEDIGRVATTIKRLLTKS